MDLRTARPRRPRLHPGRVRSRLLLGGSAEMRPGSMGADFFHGRKAGKHLILSVSQQQINPSSGLPVQTTVKEPLEFF